MCNRPHAHSRKALKLVEDGIMKPDRVAGAHKTVLPATLVFISAWLTRFPDGNPSATAEAKSRRPLSGSGILLPGYPQLLKMPWFCDARRLRMIAAGLSVISSRSTTDLDAEVDRFRGGVRPISARKWTDFAAEYDRSRRGARRAGVALGP